MKRPRGEPGPRLSPRETLLFEAGVKLGGVFHQYLGIPVSEQTAHSLARAIESAVGLQPFVERVTVRIRPERGGPLGPGRYSYRYLIPEMLEVSVELVDGSTRVRATLQHRPDLHFPLMRVVGVNDPRRGGPAREPKSRPVRERSTPRRRRTSA